MKCILDILPFYTKRLMVKQTSIDDVDLILKMDKQEDTQQYLGGIKNKSRAERIEFLDKKRKKCNSMTVFCDEVPIGFVELKIVDNKAEISYIFDSDYTGNGYCTEVLEHLIDTSFKKLGLIEIYAFCKEANIASQKVLLKNNFIINDYDNKEFIYYVLKGE